MSLKPPPSALRAAPRLAPHVQAAIQAKLASARTLAPHVEAAVRSPIVQAKPAGPPRAAAPHVQAAIQKATVQAKPAELAPRTPAAHVRAAIQRTARPGASTPSLPRGTGSAAAQRKAAPAASPLRPAFPPRAPAPAPRVVQCAEYKYKYINSREFACGSMPMMTDSVATCVAVILHDPQQKKGCLSHVDTDIFEGGYDKRSPFLLRSIDAMVSKLGSTPSNLVLYALGGTGWLNKESFGEALGGKLKKVLFVDAPMLLKKKILYNPADDNPVQVVEGGVQMEPRMSSYEKDVEGYEDKALLFQVNFGDTDSYEEVLSEEI